MVERRSMMLRSPLPNSPYEEAAAGVNEWPSSSIESLYFLIFIFSAAGIASMLLGFEGASGCTTITSV
jgi:hypothetical protein